MERLVCSIITVVLFSGILPVPLHSEEEQPVIDVGESAAVEAAETPKAPEAEVSEQRGEVAAEVVEKKEENSASSAVPSAPAREWELPVQKDSGVRIRKIYEFLNDPGVTKTGKDRSLEYEFKYFNHGAITKAQIYNRKGQYYVVTWSNKNAPADCELRLDYRQSKTRDVVNTITIPYPHAKGTYKGTFSITGDKYAINGGILSWRISVVRNGTIVAEKKSFVW